MTEQTEGFVASYAGLFRDQPGRPTIREIEIPLIQRDYAQGRGGTRVEEIRTDFLRALHAALTTGKQLSLDFVYGEIDARGTFRPLDGQQRLTTLFLVHCYLANRVGAAYDEADWKRFSYATRPGARTFCGQLANNPGPTDGNRLSVWVEDQSWYQYLWRHDPTIRSMLVVLDAIQDVFSGDDETAHATAWSNLIAEDSAIRFHVLTLPDTGRGADLYIKMNSRGKALTEFETFKARFEAAVKWAGTERTHELATRFDGSWSDLLWKISSDDLVDDDFVKYIGYLTEIGGWLDGRAGTAQPATIRLAARAEHVFGEQNPQRSDRLSMLFHAFDTWMDAGVPVDVHAAFRQLFVTTAELDEPDPPQARLLLFGRTNADLLQACCYTYGEMIGKARVFSLGDGLLLYAVLLHRQEPVPDFARRLRVLRNLIEASVNELRPDRGPELVADVHALIRDGDLSAVTGLNQRQVKDEERKRAFLSDRPDLEPALFGLEDHDLLRGRLATFDLDPADPDRILSRRHCFEQALRPEQWPGLTAALLTKGAYGRNMGRGYFRLGSPTAGRWWRELFTGAADADIARNRQVLAAVLDDLHGHADVAVRLTELRADWLAATEQAERLDWRYYLVRYAVMRTGETGVYYSQRRGMGYELCMLSTKSILGYYRDPYLEAMIEVSGTERDVGMRWFRYDVERWLGVGTRGTLVRAVERGLEIRPPEDVDHAATLRSALLSQDGVSEDGTDLVLAIAQQDVNGAPVDTEDRVQVGAALIRSLVDAGL